MTHADTIEADMAVWWRQHCRPGDEVRVLALTRDVDTKKLKANCLPILETVLKYSLGETGQKLDEDRAVWQTVASQPKHEVLRAPSDDSPLWFGFASPIASRIQGAFVMGFRYQFLTVEAVGMIYCDILDSSLPLRLESLLDACNTSRDDLTTHDPSIEDNKSMGHRPEEFLTESSATFHVASDDGLSLHEHVDVLINTWAKAAASMLEKKQLLMQWVGVKQGHCTTITAGFDVDTGTPIDCSSHLTATTMRDMTLSLPQPNKNAGMRLVRRDVYYPNILAFEYETSPSEYQLRCFWDSRSVNPSQARKLIEHFNELYLQHKAEFLCHKAAPKPKTHVGLSENKHSDDNSPNSVSKSDQAVILQFNSREIKVANESVSQLVSKSARNTPTAIAVDSWDTSLSFAALEDLSTRLSQHFRDTIGSERKPILTIFRKSALAVMVLLAILKSGNHYVPADPSHPGARIQVMKEQAGCVALVTSEECEQVAAGVDGAPAQVITLDFIHGLPSVDDFVKDTSELEGPCVVLFTSGSTGTPKGVLLSHKAVATSLSDHGQRIGLSPASRMLSFASYAFDAHLWDTWSCLIYGGTVCIPNEKERMDDLQGFMTRSRITVGLLMPAALEFLEPAGLSTLQTLIAAGEAVTSHQLARWADTGIRVANGYGPTECSVLSTLKLDLKASDPTDLGQPVGGQCWIVDPTDHNVILPCDTEGELVITGEHLAQHYIADKEKTIASFVHLQWPSWAPQGQRAYRTGDLAVLDSQGILRIRGRKDRQIKLYGLRIERTELEHLIAACEMHDSVPVVEKVSGAWGDRLVCFMVPRGMQAAFFAVLSHVQELEGLEAKIRSRLQETVPSGWVPGHFVFVTQIPLNTSDKVDRVRLVRAYEEGLVSEPRKDSGMATPSSEPTPSFHAPDISQAQKETIPAQDIDNMNQQIREVWARVLGVEANQIGDNIDFLRLGGSSLHAIKVVSAMRSQGLVATTAQILGKATVRDLAMCCLSSKARPQACEAAGDDEDPLPFSLL
ncbi:hypothetical protein Q7P35_001442 [Cladosporium inversicolor]